METLESPPKTRTIPTRPLPEQDGRLEEGYALL